MLSNCKRKLILRLFSSVHLRIQSDQFFLDFMRFSEIMGKNDTREILDYTIFKLNLPEAQ